MRFGLVIRAIAATAVLLVAVGCAPAGTGDDRDRPSVVATTTQVGSIARALAGDAFDVTVLLEPGVEAHDFELTPEKAAALERADLLLVSGAGLEDWLDDTLEATGGIDRVRDLSEGIELRSPPDGDGIDPHYWLSGPNQVRMVDNARQALVEAAPAAAGEIEARAAELIGRIEAADAAVRDLIGSIPERDRKVVTDHDALGYFIDEYGLEFAGSIFPSLDVSSDPSPREIEVLVGEIREAGVRAIFTESSVDPRLARAIAEEAGARVVEEPIYTDSLGEEGSGAETLDRMLLHNARVIRDGLTGG